MIGTQVSASLVWRLAISDCLVGGLRNRALDYTSSGMVGGFCCGTSLELVGALCLKEKECETSISGLFMHGSFYSNG